MDWFLLGLAILYAFLGYLKQITKAAKKQESEAMVDSLIYPYRHLQNSNDSYERALYHEIQDDAWRVVRGKMSREQFDRLHGAVPASKNPSRPLQIRGTSRTADLPVTVPVQQVRELYAVIKPGVLEFAGHNLSLAHKDWQGVAEAIRLLPQGSTLHIALAERTWFVEGKDVPADLAVLVDVVRGLAEARQIRLI